MAFCLALTPAVFLAVLIFEYGVDFPQWDEWGYVSFFRKLSLHTLTFSDLFAQVNEYRQFFPNLTFVVLGRLSRWDLRYEMWASFLVVCFISFNVHRLARRTIDGSHVWRIFLFFLANLLIFSPTQYENWFQGQQLVYYVPIACVTTCVLVAHSRLPPGARFLICGCLSTVSTFSSANGVVCWVVVLPVLLTASHERIRGARWLLAGWIAGLLSNAALYLYGYHKPWWSPSMLSAPTNPLRAVIYFLGFLGAPLGLLRGTLAILVGILLLSLYAVGCAVVVRFRHDTTFVRRVTPWLMVGAYAILTGVMTTIGRVGIGVGQSLSTRYIGYSAYLSVALVFLVPIVTEKLAREGTLLGKRRLAQLAFAAGVVLLLWQPLVFTTGIRGMKAMRVNLMHAKASVLLINQVKDPELVIILYPDLKFLAAQANILDRLGYLRPGLVRSNRLQDFESDGTGFGSLDHLERHDNIYVVSGIATLPYRHEAADAVLLTYDQPNGDCIAFALTHPGLETADSHNPDYDGRQFQRWELSFSVDQLPAHPAKLTAWAFDASNARAYRLDGNYVVP